MFENNLSLNTGKNKELIIKFRRSQDGLRCAYYLDHNTTAQVKITTAIIFLEYTEKESSTGTTDNFLPLHDKEHHDILHSYAESNLHGSRQESIPTFRFWCTKDQSELLGRGYMLYSHFLREVPHGVMKFGLWQHTLLAAHLERMRT